MKKKQLASLRAKSKEELLKMVDEKTRELVEIKLGIKTSKKNNPHLFKNSRHDLARIKTILKEKKQ